MKQNICLIAAFALMGFVSNAQGSTPELKKEVIESKANSKPDPTVAALSKPTNNVKGEKANNNQAKQSGEVYGSQYSDVVIDNWTNYYIDIYINGNYRGTVSPWDKRTTWAIPGTNRLYAKAPFTDGTYYYWGPHETYTGYSYTWKLNP